MQARTHSPDSPGPAAEATAPVSPELRHLLDEIAAQTELGRRRAERVAVISRISRLITGSLSLDVILDTAVAALADHLHYHTIAVMLVDPEQPDTLVTRARGGLYLESVRVGYRQAIDQGIAGAAARARRPIVVDDVRADPRYIAIPGGEHLIAELALPLLAGDRLVGVLNVEAERPFSADDAADFEIVAAQLAIAIENARLYEEMRLALEDTRLLYATSRRISTALEIDAVALAYLEQVATLRRYTCSVALYELDEAGVPVAVVVRGRWSPRQGVSLVHERLPRSRDRFDDDLDAGRTVTIADIRTDPRVSVEFRRLQMRRSKRPSLAMIPLVAGGRRLGLVILSSARVEPWTDTELHPYQITAGQLAAALDSRRQQRLVAEGQRRLAALEERQRIARDLHDAVAQSIFSATLIGQTLAPVWARDPAEGERRLDRLIALNRAALVELRGVVAELRPPAAVDQGVVSIGAEPDGLVAALGRHIAGLADGPAIEFDAAGYVAQSRESEHALLRIAQEALHNVAKYARARRVLFTLVAAGETVRMTITDDGSGFDPAEPGRGRPDAAGGGQGLAIMRERAAALGGDFRLASTPGGGTTVEVTLPRKDGRTP